MEVLDLVVKKRQQDFAYGCLILFDEGIRDELVGFFGIVNEIQVFDCRVVG